MGNPSLSETKAKETDREIERKRENRKGIDEKHAVFNDVLRKWEPSADFDCTTRPATPIINTARCVRGQSARPVTPPQVHDEPLNSA
jgi:hypothetical protein